MKKRIWIPLILILILAAGGGALFYNQKIEDEKKIQAIEIVKPKVLWFIPSGLRADPDVFTIYKWAEEGKLPNLKILMDQGSYGYSVPVHPGVSASNFATLFTGELPNVHGIADGSFRPIGTPIQQVTRSGLSSTSYNKPPLWTTLEEKNLISTLISVPGSTPVQIKKGNVVKGRYSIFGVEFPSVVYQSSNDESFVKKIGYGDRQYGSGKRLTLFSEAQKPGQWAEIEKSYSPAREVILNQWDFAIYALLIDTTNNRKLDYDCAIFSLNRQDVFVRLCEGEWSNWEPVQLSIQQAPPAPYVTIDSSLKIKVIRLGKKDFFRIRVLYDGLNDSLTFPKELSKELHTNIGPMVDYADSFPLQLNHFDQDKNTLIEEVNFSFEWHQKALDFFMTKKKQSLLVHSIASPQQMLSSRWWLKSIDPQSRTFKKSPQKEKDQAMDDVLAMYKRIDNLLGDAITHRDPNTYVVLSSDHGAAALNTLVHLNDFFQKRGWLSYSYDKTEKKFVIDWDNTRVVFLQSNHVYLNPRNVAGFSKQQTGEEYEKLRQYVRTILKELKNQNDEYPFEEVLTREQAHEQMSLPTDAIGDLVLVSRLGYLPTEDISGSKQIFESVVSSGYAQTLDPKKNKSLWTPFVVMGPGIKKNHAMENPLEHVDQYRFIMELLDQKVSSASTRDLRSEISEK